MNKLAQKPLVSIIIPVYNTSKYLRECLDSFVNQTCQELEIICIDDGSTDNSYNILLEYKKTDSRFIILKQDNKGAANARNKGISTAKGKYLLFADSDDVFDRTMLEKLLKNAEENRADMVICSAKKIDENGTVDENTNPLWPLNLYTLPLNKVFSAKDYPEQIMDMFCVVPWNKLFLADMVKNNSLKFQNLTSCNDISFGYLTRFYAERIFATDEKLVFYRCNREGSIGKKRADSASNVIHACKEVKKFLTKKNLYNTYQKTFISAFTNRIRAEVSICSKEQYDKFLCEMKNIMPEGEELFKNALKKSSIALTTLENSIGEKKVYLWGASLFLSELLKSETSVNPNILGVIDKNISLHGKTIGAYKIFSPEILNTEPSDAILLTVFSNNELVHAQLKKELNKNYPNIELLENIFK